MKTAEPMHGVMLHVPGELYRRLAEAAAEGDRGLQNECLDRLLRSVELDERAARLDRQLATLDDMLRRFERLVGYAEGQRHT